MSIPLFSWLFLIQVSLILSATVNSVLVFGQCLSDQRLLLLQLKDSLNFSSGSTKLDNWNPQEDCCSWKGVGCDSLGRVISLELDGKSIAGGIQDSSSLFRLHHLEILNLAYNSFSSSHIPRGISNLSNLVYLNLSNAGFVGQIPIELSYLRNLVYLDISTLFPGIQPLKLEEPNLQTLVQRLSNLRELYLDGVDLSVEQSEWSQALASSLPHLEVLSLSNCNITGPIGSSLSEIRGLSVVRLDKNNLSTTVPDFLANFSNLTILSLSSSNLLGQFPEKIFQVPTLQNLDLTNNKFLQGRLPQFSRGASFRIIALSYTNFSGSLPNSIGYLSNLSRIELSNSNFRGPIPSSMKNLTNLVYLDFSFNNFTGPVPSFQNSRNLTYVDLSRNALSGSVSSTHFEGLSYLVNINLGLNLLNGKIPPSIFKLPSLRKLQLSNNQFSGQVEFSNASTSLLDTLDLSSNNLNGSIPWSFFELGTLNVLSLSSNSFSGTVQLETIMNLPNLTRLELSHNNLSVVLHSNNLTSPTLAQLSVLKLSSCKLLVFPELSNQSRMTYLDLSDNKISGKVPTWIWRVGDGSLIHLNLSNNLLDGLEKPNKFPNLAVLDLHSNQLHGEVPIPPTSAIYVDYSGNKFNGTIPLNIGNSIPYSSFFSLSNNDLTGPIPKSMCNAINLLVLDLSDNNLCGTVPSCLVANISSLGVLNLARNHLSGSIPDSFPFGCGLKTLDLSMNGLQGKVPGSLVNCRLLEVLNIGNNQIEDAFPCVLKDSSSLRVLVLRTNKFYGEVQCPGSSNIWLQLQIIDIASNNFSGVLSSPCFSNWKNMMFDGDNEESRGDHLRFNFLDLNNFYYQDKVTVTMKGLEMELVKILTVFTSVDFSSNKFVGPIPDSIGDLTALYVLNLSHNGYTGRIPPSIGKLINLGSLDLSSNHLSGEIPATLVNLTFLSFLNLSYNNLNGRIPSGSQFQTFSEATYEGNLGLCGYPMPTQCSTQNTTPSPRPYSAAEFDWGFIFTGLGLGVGAAVIFAPLVFSRKGRNRYDENLHKMFLLLFPSYKFMYIRYDEGKIVDTESLEDSSSEDSQGSDEEEYEDSINLGAYCVFCTKLDAHRKKAIHDLNCTCHDSPPNFNLSHTSSSTCSLLVMYH